ncbi:uncharacterized protein LACBIDRAFT_307066 [Laccaria bicolor S238N-H82]|uniref:Predicted protein n=1 Tax=Laccaria bicolor (strain S238N-H82 / ATCC MYA-4686) TaxID=486041 RepID=B0DPA5_LACBS|nr:uncharacterized protein LACBIDRAFT_307066 [Laccaria bicolor S238N-H82]EDR03649.1 predicted protein [Laccaria bicolor S238N-H82]|eukprot:XP_001885797.1 predicted protein [Laccaria bicolor S238N-H82]
MRLRLLSDGPPDIIIYIQQFLHPLDILALRLTCKSLSKATRARSVWMNAVHNVCITHGAFLPSFPLEEMSLDDLEHTALSPRRFQAVIQKYDGHPTEPLLTRKFVPRLQPRQSGGAAMKTAIDQMALIPGGRFLLTSTYSGNLYLWDLGFNAGSHMKSLPIAMLETNEGSQGGFDMDNFWFNCGPMANSGGIYVVAESNFIARDNVKAVCYEIFPKSEFPNFHRIGAAAIPGPITSAYTRLSFDYYACCRGSFFTVWNFTADLGVSWNQHGDAACTAVYTAGDNIITFHAERYLLWRLPDLQTLDGDLLPCIIDHSPTMSFSYPSDVGVIYNGVVLPSVWLPQASQKHFLTYQRDIMMHFIVKSIDTVHDASLPEILPVRVGSVQGGPIPSLVRDLMVTDNGLFQTWESDDSTKITANVISMLTPQNPTYSSLSSVLWSRERSLGSLVDFVVCTMTGRVVIQLRQKIDDNHYTEIQVMDFLLPKPFQ